MRGGKKERVLHRIGMGRLVFSRNWKEQVISLDWGNVSIFTGSEQKE